MKASAPTLVTAIPAEKSWVSVYADLFKARLTLLVLLTTMVGFYMGHQGGGSGVLILHTVLGMALVAGGGAALNELIERDHDALMRRTRERPLPSGRLTPQTVLLIGLGCGALGILYLAWAVNALTAVLAAATLALYTLVYTPLKRITWLNTLVGAIPGAMPPLVGWVAARGEIGAGGVALFAIQAFWQIPHFMAIAWLYREEYAGAGFKMLPVFDASGVRTSRHALVHTGALFLASLAPFALGHAGVLYLAVAIVLGGFFLATGLLFARDLTKARARQFFYASIIYLPLLLITMVLDRATL